MTDYLFDFHGFIKKLRNDDKKRILIDEYEKFVLNGKKITSDIKDQKWYKNYLCKFEKLPKYQVPADLEDEFDWTLLFQLITGSLTTDFRLSSKDDHLEGKNALPDLLIAVRSGDKKIEKAVSELWSFQIIRLFEIYIEELIKLETILCRPDASRQEKKRIRDEKKQCIKNYENILYPDKPQKNINDIVAHYCSLNSAFEIIKSGKMFASDLSYMNDKEELTFGIDIMMTALREISKESKVKHFKEWLEEIIRNDNKLRTDLEQKPVFISCFSRKIDDLNQWRAYGDNGNGVCIVFDFGKTIGDPLSDGFYIGDVNYLSKNYNKEDKEWKVIIKEIKKEFNVIYKQYKKTKQSLQISDVISDFLTSNLKERIRFYKNIKFKEEEEYRQVCLNEGDPNECYEVKTRPGKEYLVPYVELSINNKERESSINKIIIGPSVKDFKKSKRSFEIYIKELNKAKTLDNVKKIIRLNLFAHNCHTFSKDANAFLFNELKKLNVEDTQEKIILKAQVLLIQFVDEITKNGFDSSLSKSLLSRVITELDSELNNHYFKNIKIVQSEIPFLP